MKKTAAFLLTFLMVFSAIPVAFAVNTQFSVKTPDKLPRKGEEFEISIDISGNPGFCALQFVLTYNKNEIDCVEGVTGEVLGSSLAAVNPDAEEGAILSMATLNTIKKNGSVALFKFKALKDVTDFGFSFDNLRLSDYEGYSIACSVAGTEKDVPKGGTGGGGSAVTPPKQENPAIGEEKPQETPTTTTEEPQSAEITFTDTANHWGREVIAKAAGLGLFNGYPDGSFKPNLSVTRAQFVTVLYRMAGKPKIEKSAPFTDIASQSDEFKTAISWAFEKGYINGVSEKEFSPSGALTREAAMKILFFYSGGQSGQEMMFTAIYDETYKDSGSISSWAKAPMYWGIYKELISGTSATELSPKKTATRAELAKILVNYIEKIK